ncbi:MAG TPA: Ig-like domain-containing protein [Saprospiraceae bacterium]|nr:Ig-like domain-containing protein [Saprospiraceae bacterium]HPI08100.1 Ig-like domain-containing protein [Saprospiraceae bacterium]
MATPDPLLGAGAMYFGSAVSGEITQSASEGTGKVTPSVCNDPLTGKNVVIDDLSGGVACVLCGNADVKNLVDGDLSNYSAFNPTAILVSTSIVSIKDIVQDYDAGTRGGFVIEPQGGLIGTGVLGSFQIRTYLNNVLQETFTGGANLHINVLGASAGKQRLSFLSTLNFDEVELVQTGLVNALSSVRVYYAFVEHTGCDYNCSTKVITGSVYNPAIENSHSGTLSGICLLCVTNTVRAVDADTTNFARLAMGLGIGAVLGVSVKAANNIPIPAGYDAGFVIRDNGLLGLLSVQVLGGMSIRTYLGGNPQETKSFSTLADLTVLGGDLQAISFKTTMPFDEIQLRIDGGLIAVGVDVRAYYAFVRPDSDNDGFVDCVDKCAGQNDNLDADGDGIPNGCDAAVCTVNAGTDLTACPVTTTAQLPAAGVGQTWSALPGNPSVAAVSSGGAVTGLSASGIYGFVLTEGACRDTVYINHQEQNLDYACNNPITGYGVIIDQIGLTGGICLLCGGGTAAIDGDLSNYSTYMIGVGVLTATSVISVKDTTQIYPAGCRTGFLVEAVGGLLDATALTTLQIRTYQNNVLRETATVGNGLLGASVLTGNGNKQRLSFVTTLSFDEVELVVTSVVGALSSIRVYYAFEEPAAGCPNLGDADLCSQDLIASDATYCGQISYDHSGITGGACVNCSVTRLGDLIDNSSSNYAIINITGGVLAARGSVSVKTRQTIPAGYVAGYTISSNFNIADVTVLSGIRITTFLNGVQRDQFSGSGLLQAKVLNAASGLSQITMKTTLTFDEVQLSMGGLASVLTSTNVYGAFVYGDSDNDGAPDCVDKCCGSSDNLDSNGDGQPDGCDPLPAANDDNVTVDSNEPVPINVLVNDSFGDDGPSTSAITIVTPPTHGTATVNNNGTPNDPTDDTIVYTSANNYIGSDQLVYRICERTGDCDNATVFINVAPVNDPPVANPDPYTMNEDTPLSGNVVSNDTDPDGPAVVVSLVSGPANGTLMLNPDGTFTYTPNTNFNGTDSFVYSYCDGAAPTPACDQATVTITVAAGSLSLSVRVQLQGALLGNVDGLMRDDLRTPVNVIPVTEPYAALGAFAHVNGGGGETVSAPATVFADNGANSIVDWVFIELRNGGNFNSVVATRSALLQRDGDVVEVDGISPVFFANSAPASYYVSIRHRNHLGVMTANAAALAASGNVVDFSSLSTPLWDDGTNLDGFEQVTISGKYALWAANSRVDAGVIFAGESNDKDAVFNQVDQAPGNILHSQTYILSGYRTGDGNLNARTIYAGQNNDVDFLFNNVDTHPRNVLRSQTFIIRQQIPQQ